MTNKASKNFLKLSKLGTSQLYLKMELLIKIFFSTLLTISVPICSSAIVNVETLRMQSPNRDLLFFAQASADKRTGNSFRDHYLLSGNLRWNQEQVEHLSLFRYRFEKSQGIKTGDQTLVHYRWSYKISNKRSFEIFSQWEQDYFRRLVFRGLIGLGERYILIDRERLKTNIGLGSLYSREDYKYQTSLVIVDEREQMFRLNSYVSLMWNFWKNIKLESVLYFQPSFNGIRDFRLLWQNQIEFPVNSSLSWLITYQRFQDNDPPLTVLKTDEDYGTAIRINF